MRAHSSVSSRVKEATPPIFLHRSHSRCSGRLQPRCRPKKRCPFSGKDFPGKKVFVQRWCNHWHYFLLFIIANFSSPHIVSVCRLLTLLSGLTCSWTRSSSRCWQPLSQIKRINFLVWAFYLQIWTDWFAVALKCSFWILTRIVDYLSPSKYWRILCKYCNMY